MVIENDPSARFQVKSQGELYLPGSCLVCGSGNSEDGYVDLTTFFDYEGHMYLCMSCARQIAALIGHFSPDEVLSANMIANQLAEENEQLKAELENARPIIAAIASFNSAALDPSTDIASPLDEESQEQPPVSTESVEPADSREPEVKESTNGSGRSNTRRVKRSDPAFK